MYPGAIKRGALPIRSSVVAMLLLGVKASQGRERNVQGSEFRVQSSGFRVQVQSSGFRVQSFLYHLI